MTNKPAVLVLHGFGGGLGEITSLLSHLRAQGHFCMAPLLPGHDHSGHISSGYGSDEFSQAAKRAFRSLRRLHEQVVIVGFSMGGLLALRLAAEFDPICVVVINVPIIPWNFVAIGYWLRDDLLQGRLYHGPRIMSSLVRQNPMMFTEYIKLVWRTLPALHRVTAPCLIQQSLRDDTAHYLSAAAIESLLVNSSVSCIYYRHSWHQIGLSPDAKRQNRDITYFLQRIFS